MTHPLLNESKKRLLGGMLFAFLGQSKGRTMHDSPQYALLQTIEQIHAEYQQRSDYLATLAKSGGLSRDIRHKLELTLGRIERHFSSLENDVITKSSRIRNFTAHGLRTAVRDQWQWLSETLDQMIQDAQAGTLSHRSCDSLLERLDCQTEILPGAEASTSNTITQQASREMHPYPRTIICPVFGATCLQATLRCASFLAKCSGARLLVVDVKDNPRSREHPGEPGAKVRRLTDAEGIEFAQLDDVHFERFELVGEPTSGICDFAQRMDADLVVLGNDVGIEGSTSLGRLTRNIANNLSCNVIVVKDPDAVPMCDDLHRRVDDSIDAVGNISAASR